MGPFSSTLKQLKRRIVNFFLDISSYPVWMDAGGGRVGCGHSLSQLSDGTKADRHGGFYPRLSIKPRTLELVSSD